MRYVYEEINKNCKIIQHNPTANGSSAPEKISKMRWHVHGKIWMLNYAIMDAVGPFNR